MKRPLLIAIPTAILALAAATLHVSYQPPGTARVIRDGESVRVLSGRFGFAPLYLSRGCTVPAEEEGLVFKRILDLRTAAGDSVELDTSFRYSPPASLPAAWPKGEWCASIDTFVAGNVQQWLRGADRDALLDDPRSAGWNAASALEGSLRQAGVDAATVAVRPRLSAELLSTRAIPEIASMAVDRPPVIVLALDGADWEYLDLLMERGVMPKLRELSATGARGVLTSEHPALSPLLWNTMMTGVSPLEHGILDFTRFHPATGNKEPITSDERKVPAVWNMLTDGGKSALVLGIWATYPAEPIRGTLVSDRFFTFLFQEEKPPPGVVWPPRREERMRALLAEVENGTKLEQLRPYLPWLGEAEYREHETSKTPYGHPISALRRVLIETTLYDRIAMEVMSESLPDLTILFIQGTDTIGHVFAPFSPPKQPEVDQAEYDRYHLVPERYFATIDELIGRYHDFARSRGARLVLVSDHGFHWIEGRPKTLSSFAQATAAKWHQQDGIFLITGPGVEPRRGLRGGIRQVAASLLALTGLPLDESIERPPLPGTPGGEHPLTDYRAHFEPVKPVIAGTGEAADEEIAKLRALGYIGAGESLRSAAPGKGTSTAGSYNNRGLILREERKMEEAKAAFDRAIEIDPNLASALWNLSDMLFAENSPAALERSDELLSRAFANDLPEGRKYLIGRAIGYQRSGMVGRSLALLEASVRAKPQDAELRMFRGRYRIEQGDCRGALEDFRVAQQIDPGNPVAFASAGLAANCLGDAAEATRNFRRAAQLDPRRPEYRNLLEPR